MTGETTCNMDPPGKGEVRVLVAVGEGASVPAALRAVLEQLGTELSEPEVAGFGMIRVVEPAQYTITEPPQMPEVQWSQWSIGF
jgi:hypothetical protein